MSAAVVGMGAAGWLLVRPAEAVLLAGLGFLLFSRNVRDAFRRAVKARPG